MLLHDSSLDRDIARAGTQPFTCHSTQLLPVLVILFLVTLFLVILILQAYAIDVYWDRVRQKASAAMGSTKKLINMRTGSVDKNIIMEEIKKEAANGKLKGFEIPKDVHLEARRAGDVQAAEQKMRALRKHIRSIERRSAALQHAISGPITERDAAAALLEARPADAPALEVGWSSSAGSTSRPRRGGAHFS